MYTHTLIDAMTFADFQILTSPSYNFHHNIMKTGCIYLLLKINNGTFWGPYFLRSIRMEYVWGLTFLRAGPFQIELAMQLFFYFCSFICRGPALMACG